jgi:hypothetical protein
VPWSAQDIKLWHRPIAKGSPPHHLAQSQKPEVDKDIIVEELTSGDTPTETKSARGLGRNDVPRTARTHRDACPWKTRTADAAEELEFAVMTR